MSSPGFGWIPLSPSRLRVRSLATAAGMCAATAIILAVAATLGGSLMPGVLSLLAAVAAAVAWRGRQSLQVTHELRVDPEGRIWRRPVSRADEQSDRGDSLAPQRVIGGAQVPGVGLSARTDTGSVFIWADSLPTEHFRLLCAHARWHVERIDGGTLTSAGPRG